MGFDVFIIHASPDKPMALRLQGALEKLKHSAFVDKTNLEAGERWDERVAAELHGSLLQVVLLGKEERWYQSEEVTRAIQRMREIGASDRVIPVLLEPRKELPYGLADVQAVPWDGAERVGELLAAKIRSKRGASADGGRVRVAVAGFWQDQPDLFANLCARLSQRSNAIDGPVLEVDLEREAPPAVDVTLLVLGSRHHGKLETLDALVQRAALAQPASGAVLASSRAFELRTVRKEHRPEALEVQDLHDNTDHSHGSDAELIEDLDERFAAWFATTHPSQPGKSATRTPWEERYLKDKAPLWRRGDPSAMRAMGNAQAERVQWYVHLKAEPPWCVLSPRELRFDITTEASSRYRSEGVPQSLLIESGAKSGSALPREADLREPADAPLDIVLSHSLLPRCVVVGQAGSGKSVLLQHLAWAMSGGAEHRSRHTDHHLDLSSIRGECAIAPIPILHNASTVVAHLRHAGGVRPIRQALVELLRSSDTFGEQADREVLRAGIDAGRYVFLIDSLDEVPNRADRAALVAALGALDGSAPRVILTTRPSVHTAVELPIGFSRVDIASLDAETANRLVAAWLQTWAPHEDAEAARAAVKSMRERFPTDTVEQSPVENPLLLGSLLQVYATYHRLPDDTAKLYADMVTTLCEAKIRATEEALRESVVVRYREALRELLFAAQERGGTTISSMDAVELLVERKLTSRDQAEAWLQGLVNHTGLLRFEGRGDKTVLRPWHRSFQEYLAAEAIVLRFANRAAECVAWMCEPRPGRGSRFGDASWVGLLRFLVGAAVHQNRTWAVALIDQIANAAVTAGPIQARLWSLAMSSAAEYKSAYFANEDVVDGLPLRLLASFEKCGQDWQCAETIEALDAAGRLGDPRLPDPRTITEFNVNTGWVYLQPGEYIIGRAIADDSDDPSAEAETVRLVGGGFWIRRWPITVAEYEAFVRATEGDSRSLEPGSLERSWNAGPSMYRRWTDSKPEARVRINEPLGSSLVHRPGGSDLRPRHPNHPVTEVTWFHAKDFCEWATRTWALPVAGIIDLPTGSEWEMAARGLDGRAYPWGNEEDSAASPRAAYDRRTRGPTPVGSFPRGTTPDGLLDMAGNVAEWTANVIDIDAATDDSEIEFLGEVAATARFPRDAFSRGIGWRTMVERPSSWRSHRVRTAHLGASGVGFRVMLRARDPAQK